MRQHDAHHFVREPSGPDHWEWELRGFCSDPEDWRRKTYAQAKETIEICNDPILQVRAS